MPARFRVLALMEGAFVTGPAKNLIQIGTYGRSVTDVPAMDLTVATFGRGDWKPEPLLEGLNRAGLPSTVLVERKRLDNAGVIAQMHALVESLQPDVIQTHMVKSHFLMRSSGLWKKHRWLAFHHGYTRVSLNVLLYNQADRWSLRAARQIVTVCGPFVDQLTNRGIPRDRITVQHNSVPPFARPEAGITLALRSKLGLTGAEPVLLSVGRLSNEKGYLDLIEAAALLRKTVPDFRVVIVGEGPERPAIEKAIAHHGLNQNVVLAGHDNYVAPYFDMATLLLMPSHSEGSPNVLLEAMAAGLPIVASAVGGIPELLAHNETGLLIPPQNPQKLAESAGGLLRDPDRAASLGLGALRQAQTKHTVAAHYHSLSRVYERILHQAS